MCTCNTPAECFLSSDANDLGARGDLPKDQACIDTLQNTTLLQTTRQLTAMESWMLGSHQIVSVNQSGDTNNAIVAIQSFTILCYCSYTIPFHEFNITELHDSWCSHTSWHKLMETSCMNTPQTNLCKPRCLGTVPYTNTDSMTEVTVNKKIVWSMYTTALRIELKECY